MTLKKFLESVVFTVFIALVIIFVIAWISSQVTKTEIKQDREEFIILKQKVDSIENVLENYKVVEWLPIVN